jgi:hypothetical protein
MTGARRQGIWAALALALGIGLGWVPLFGVLGFELATATALFAAVMGLDVGSALARARQRRPPAPGFAGPSMVRATLDAAARAMAIAALPAVVAIVRSLWQPTCAWGFGLACYAAMPLATAALAGATGHALGVVVGPRRIVGAAVAQIPTVAVVLGALYRFYSAPPVFTYNAILGYFPGNLYDENIQLHAALAWSRLADLCWVVALVALVTLRVDVPGHRVARAPRPAGPRTRALAVAALAIAGAAALHHLGGALGFAPDAEDLEAVLDGKIETAHFTIHYAHSKEIDAEIDAIAADHELRYAQVVAQLGAAPPGKLRSFYFADRDQKARWFGARDVEMAKPWRREIYLDHRAFPHGSLRHEIAHAVASAFGDPLFGVATRHGVFANPGLIEGLAVAIDWPGGYDRLTPHEAVRALQELGLEPSIGQLLSLQFFSVSSARGYTTAGSFLRYLLDTHGAAKLRALYRSGGDFDAAYGVPRAQLEAGWKAMLARIVLPPGTTEAQRERFRGGSVFARACPHAVAAWRDEAAAALGRGDRAEAIAWLRRTCDVQPDEPRHRMTLADVLSAGDPRAQVEALALYATLLGDPEATSTLRVEVLERLARAAAARGDRAAVAGWIARAAELPLDDNARRQLDAEQLALAHQGAAARPLYAYFFLPGTLDAATLAQWAVLAEPDLAIAHYLLGLQRQGLAIWDGAAAELDRALSLGLPGPLFVRNAARRLAIASYRAHDRGRVERAIAILAGPEMTTPDHLLAQDWRERLAFTSR